MQSLERLFPHIATSKQLFSTSRLLKCSKITLYHNRQTTRRNSSFLLKNFKAKIEMDGSDTLKTFTETLKLIVPTLEGSKYKGQAGKVGVIGGSAEYTGAPYFAAISALKVGADLSHVFCQKAAAPVIKSYSPELIVHPVLEDSTEYLNKTPEVQETAINGAVEKIQNWLERIDCLVVGPGLGRDELTEKIVTKILKYAREKQLPLILDGDGLFIVTKDLSLVRGNKLAVLTPNVNEFKRLVAAAKLSPQPEIVSELASNLGGVTILEKGPIDRISDGISEVQFGGFSSPRRCGGQGDVLAGTVAVFMAWFSNALKRNSLENGEREFIERNISSNPAVVAALGASIVVRKASSSSFLKHKRSMMATNVIEELGGSMEELFPVF